jgi:predicted component of type VI protein secretion system
VGLALVVAVLLEAANWAFLAKRQRLARLLGELAEARDEGTRLRQLLRDASKLQG